MIWGLGPYPQTFSLRHKSNVTSTPGKEIVLLSKARAARSIFVHAPGILNFHGDTHKLDSSNYKALVLTHFLAHLRCAH